jgi:hypothetical protein
MKKYILTILTLIPVIAYSCNGYVVGFKGKDNAFDNIAFSEYAKHKDYCKKTFNWNQHSDAIKFIKTINVEYQLYGFSKGAETVAHILKQSSKMPEYVITIGAYKTTNVNFDKYGIKYNNYFDHSGVGQSSPGVFLDVSHNKIQQKVNEIIFR